MKKRFIISGGGTGGHIFPAIAIANRIKKVVPDAEILFIGASDKMEMRRVPDAGYKIEGLHIYGISRDLSLRGIWKNLKLPFVLMKANSRAKEIIRNFNPDVAIGVGGFASYAALNAAHKLGVPTLIQEQNSYPGVTNKRLAPKVKKICVAYDGLERFFPAEKIVKTVKSTDAIVSGPIPLPTHKRIYTVNRSTFVNKKSREQFELCTYKRLIDIYSSTTKTVDALMKLELPSGVEVEIKV